MSNTDELLRFQESCRRRAIKMLDSMLAPGTAYALHGMLIGVTQWMAANYGHRRAYEIMQGYADSLVKAEPQQSERLANDGTT